MFCFNIPRCNLTEAADIVFPSSMLVPCWFTVFVSGLDIQPQNVKPVFGCFCFVLRWWTSGKITSERLFIAKCCHQEWAAHALLTFCSRLLTLCSRSRFAHDMYDMYVQRSFWAQRTQKVYPILWYYDMFLCSPKGPKSTSIDGIVQRSF